MQFVFRAIHTVGNAPVVSLKEKERRVKVTLGSCTRYSFVEEGVAYSKYF